MKDTVLLSAQFNPAVKTYWLLSGALVMVTTIIGIPFLLLWFPIGLWATGRYLENMSAELIHNKLIVKKGILTRVEKTVPLDKITDMALVQGPIMRFFRIHRLSVETAGQSGPGSLINLTGVVDAKNFRERVLEQRDALAERSTDQSSAPRQEVSEDRGEILSVLREISATLKRLEAQGRSSG